MIVVGIDGSMPSRAAVRWSIDRAAATGEDVMLAHVVDDEWGVVSHRLLDEVRAEAEELVAAEAEFARSLDATVSVVTDLREGNPMWELAAAAEDADLVVVGAHKTRIVRGRAFGSRSLQLAGSSSVPVAIIPDSAPRTARGVLVGVNDSASSREAVTFAAQEARRLGEELILIGAWASPQPAESDITEASRRRRGLVISHIEGLLRDARKEAEADFGDLAIRTLQVNHPAAATLVDAAASATLLVIGSSRREPSPAFLGSVAHDVLINLVAPTVVVHAVDEGSAAAPRQSEHFTARAPQ